MRNCRLSRESRVTVYLRALDLQAQEIAHKLGLDPSTISRKINPDGEDIDEIDFIEVGRGIERCMAERASMGRG